jgi:DNA replication protein DnaC
MKKLNRTELDQLIEVYLKQKTTVQKGIFLIGNPGVGKTQRLSKISPEPFLGAELGLLNKIGELKHIVSKCKSNLLFAIDDLGSEGKWNYESITQLILLRYALWKQNRGFKFFGSTNMNPEQLETLYPSIWDKIREMCTVIHLDDMDLREQISEETL